LRIDTSSMPITVGAGVPPFASWARMYCLSSSLTVCQSSLSSCATSKIGALRQRRPTSKAIAWCKAGYPPDTPDARASPCRNAGNECAAPRTQGICAGPRRRDRAPGGPCDRTSQPASSTPAAGRFFDRRTSTITRPCGSPKIPRTRSTGRKPANRYASRKRCRFAEVTRIALRIAANGSAERCPIRDQNPRTVKSARSPYLRRSDALKSSKLTHTSPRRPHFKWTPEARNASPGPSGLDGG
jgi:hypothetical protein